MSDGITEIRLKEEIKQLKLHLKMYQLREQIDIVREQEKYYGCDCSDEVFQLKAELCNTMNLITSPQYK